MVSQGFKKRLLLYLSTIFGSGHAASIPTSIIDPGPSTPSTYVVSTNGHYDNTGTLPAPNLTANERVIDINPKFTVNLLYDIDEINIGGDAVLINAVNAMVQMALQPYASPLQGTVFTLDIYRNIKISVVSPFGPQHPLQRRYGLWGLDSCMLSWIRNGIYDAVHCHLYWLGQTVGIIEISKNDDKGASASTEATDTAIDNSTFASSRPAWQDPHLTIHDIQADLPSLPKSDVFISVLQAIRYMAVAAADYPLQVAQLSCNAANTVIPYRTYSDLPQSSNDTTPFENQYFIKSLAGVSADQLANGKFEEIGWKVAIDGTEVGYGAIFRPFDLKAVS